jgi:hypothetical protein
MAGVGFVCGIVGAGFVSGGDGGHPARFMAPATSSVSPNEIIACAIAWYPADCMHTV